MIKSRVMSVITVSFEARRSIRNNLIPIVLFNFLYKFQIQYLV